MNEGYSMKKWIILKSKEKKRKKYVAQQRVYLAMKEGIRRNCLTMSLLKSKVLNQITCYKLHFLADEAEGTVCTIICIRHMGVYRYEQCVCF